MAPAEPPFLPDFLEAADAVAEARPDVHRDVARELMGGAAAMLHNGLALDGLDEHDPDGATAAYLTAVQVLQL